MQYYQFRGYEMKVLGELQRQQNSAQFCDTLLQTEGISVPTHSCLLAAVSPFLSKKLAAIPSPAFGQKRMLRLQSLKAHTLLKLVSLLYSGKLEVKGSLEHKDVMAAVQMFGIASFIERQTNEATKEVEPKDVQVGSCCKCTLTGANRDGAECLLMKDPLLQAEVVRRKDRDRSLEKRTCVSIGTQTLFENQNDSPTPEHITFQSKDIPLDMCESSSHHTSTSRTNSLSDEVFSNWTCSSNNDTSFSQRLQHGCFDSIGSADVLSQTNDRSKASADEERKVPEDENANTTKRRPAMAEVAKKNLAKMKLNQSTQFSLKVKLRRRAKEQLWEVVSLQDEDETVSVFASLSQVFLHR
ncbi:mitochondrial import inner membrane translocase subunit Tim10 isoform X2 [Corythoichthys intestinalis]|uniref:mitochondrial import inner membrane translocase subunit Tim10 isoform X2 n=1 Tax=Corythoichthys intestinalis TaxID=161448 RepID=UPI0025A671B2|nr:mitochondrial import inner membrane translocase subunit Tim10 isoform X2 [Corythoichthys intestinalis]